MSPKDHVPVVVRMRTPGKWGVVCHGCSTEQQEYVTACRFEPDEWPPDTLYEGAST